MRRILKYALLILPISTQAMWNVPHQKAEHDKTVHAAFAASPKTLDPAKAYSSNEAAFTAQIYEPVLQYDIHAYPYKLKPLTARSMPNVSCFNNLDQKTTCNSKTAYSVYTITIKPHIYFQPHPAFAKQKPLHKKINTLSDFKNTGTRELTANDYTYQIKRLAHPQINSPIFGLMAQHIIGLKNYRGTLAKAIKKAKQANVDLRQHPLEGVRVLSRYQYQIKIKGYYPQFMYWLAMPFFAPMPHEADAFYSQPTLKKKNISLNWYPIGTGQYYLSKNDPNREMILQRNPNFNHEPLADVDRFVFSLDKESIPRWSKFLQGYYDQSGVSSDSFDQVIQFDKKGLPILTQAMKDKGIKLKTQVEPAFFYIGFNMKDSVVGGLSAKKRALRQAIAIAMDYEEYISIFLNGRGQVAHSPIPPGVFGVTTKINPIIYKKVNGTTQRRHINEAKALLKKAGFTNGINPKTGKPLVLHFDIASSGNPDDQTYFNWLRKQFAKLGISLNIRATHYNRFQDVMRKGKAQLFSWGWMADYPDPENFLFLLYGPNGKADFHGENAGNYHNPEFDHLFKKMQSMPNSQKRLAIIKKLITIIQKDSPALFGFHPVSYTLSHAWINKPKPNAMTNNTLKYIKLDAKKRQTLQKTWNSPILWPVLLLLICITLLLLPLFISYKKRGNKPAIKRTS